MSNETEKRSPDYKSVLALVKEIGSKNGFEPIPWDQIAWHGRSDQAPLQRMWAWMIGNTLRKGRWSPYAIAKGGEELYVEHFAAADGMDLANAYMYWRKGVQMGLWRNGTQKEGKRRLYICGTVTAQEDEKEGEEKEMKDVSTYNLPRAIWFKVKQWEPDRRGKFLMEWNSRREVRNAALAEVVKATRDILDEDDDTLFQAYGLPVSRQEHVPRGAAPEEIQARQERIAKIKAPLQLYVQTIQALVQTEESDSYKPEYADSATTAPLLSSDLLDNPEIVGSRHNNLPTAGAEKPQAALTGKGRSSYPRSKEAAAPGADAKVEAQSPAKSDAEWRAENKAAHEELTLELQRMQAAYPKTDFGLAEFDPDSRPGAIFLARVLTAIGGRDQIPHFTLYVASKFRGLDRHAMGKLPARAPGMANGPRGLGLIWEWAQDFGKRGRARGASS